MILQANIGAGMSEKTFFFNYYFFYKSRSPTYWNARRPSIPVFIMQ